MDPNGKVAIVTGGASGIGEAVSDVFLAAGASVVVLDLKSPQAASGAAYVRCDVADPASAEAAIADVVCRFGRIDICMNCAGIGSIGPVATADGPQDPDEFKRVIDVNLIGVHNITRLAAHSMIANLGDGPDSERGIIITASSIGGIEGQQGMGAYTASKAAVNALTLVWARDLSAHRIRVLSIAAGFFATPMTAGLPGDLVDDLVSTIEYPRRAGRPEEFAELALFLVRSPYINADIIRLDGGARSPAARCGRADRLHALPSRNPRHRRRRKRSLS